MKKGIAIALEEALRELSGQEGAAVEALPDIILSQPPRAELGVYSCNAAMLGAKLFRKPPMVLAAEIIRKLEAPGRLPAAIERVEAAAPGFLNFHVRWPEWAKPGGQDEGASEQGPKVLIEHTSINPNKSAHIGHLRNSCIGDALARLLTRTGCRVEVHNYIDDLGNQLADTLVGLKTLELKEERHARFGDFCWELYARINRAYKEMPELQKQREEVLHGLEQGDNNTAWMGLLVAERIVREHVEEMAGFGIGYDVLVWESSIVREGFWEAAFGMLKAMPEFVLETEGKHGGCWVLKQGERGGCLEAGEPAAEGGSGAADYQADKVLVRSNGILTYTAKDIAYHLWKFGLLEKDFTYKRFGEGLWSTSDGGTRRPIGKADRVINVIDQRQEYPQAVVKQALGALGFRKQASALRHVAYGVVSLSPATAQGLGIDISEGKASYPMSGRQGIGVKIADLLTRMEQIVETKRSRKAGLSSRTLAAAAIRYYLLRFHLQTEVVFDLEQATEITGNTGIYLMYTYARTCSVLKKAERQQIPIPPIPSFGDEPDGQELLLLRHLAYWPDTLEQAAADLSPQSLCSYAYELCSLFNHFYAACPVLKAEEPVRGLRLWLTKRVQDTLRDALTVLGLPAPSRM